MISGPEVAVTLASPIEVERGRRRRGSTPPLGLPFALWLASGCPDPHHEALAPCSDEAAQAACRRDAALTGRYPAVDAVIEPWLATADAPPGCGLGIVVGDAVVYVRGYGLAHLGADDRRGGGGDGPFTLASLSALGSVSKTITAIALHRMIDDRGGVGPSLDDRLGDALPDAPAWLADRTVRQLLNHSAGVASLSYGDAYDDPYLDDSALGRRFVDYAHPTEWPRITYWGLRDNLAAAEPGVYANVNYHLIGAIIDAHQVVDAAEVPALTLAAMGARGFADDPEAGYVRQVVDGVAHGAADPDDHLISMCTRTPWSVADVHAVARGHAADGEEIGGVRIVSGRIASGGWLMSAGDFARFVALLGADALVERAALRANPQRITTIGLGAGNPRVYAGEGAWVMSHVFPDMSQAPAIHHLGRVDGYTAYYRLTDAQPTGAPAIGVALLCDGRVDNAAMVSLAQAVIDAVHDDVGAGGDALAPSIDYDPAIAGCDE